MTHLDEATMERFVKAVRAHALENYNEGGWDFVVEAWEEGDIAQCIADAHERRPIRTEEAAIRAVGNSVRCLDTHRSEIKNTEW